MAQYGPITSCQVCSCRELRSVFFLGYLPPVNTMRKIGSALNREEWFPAEWLYCPRCHLVQLGYAVERALLFPPTYPYTSGSTRVLRDNFDELHQEACAMLRLSPGDLVVDIGSNDGTLLQNFMRDGHRVVGIEPTLAAQIAQQRGIPTVASYFDREAVRLVKGQYGTARVVTAANVFAHILEVHDVLDGIEALLDRKGVFISESHYLGDLLTGLQYDTIYHEHLRYYSLISLSHLLQMHGFRIFHVKRIPTHGGSIRVYATKSDDFPVYPSVHQMLEKERDAGLNSDGWGKEFRSRVVLSKLELYELLSGLKRQNALIYGIGAPSRASTLITYLGLDDGIMDCVLELPISKKIGHYIPGTKVPILPETRLYEEQPPFVLLLSWHIASELCRNLKRQGYKGDFVIPLPKPRVVRNSDVALDGAAP